MYPAFVNCTTIDWFSEWPSDALLEVADKYLDGIEMSNPDEVRFEKKTEDDVVVDINGLYMYFFSMLPILLFFTLSAYCHQLHRVSYDIFLESLVNKNSYIQVCTLINV